MQIVTLIVFRGYLYFKVRVFGLVSKAIHSRGRAPESPLYYSSGFKTPV
jgi:hypothetical protein